MSERSGAMGARHLLVLLVLLLVGGAAAVGCGSDRVPRSDGGYGRTGPDAPATDGPMGPPIEARCLPAQTAEPLPARVQVTAEEVQVGGGDRTVFYKDLFGLVRNHCGQCHIDSSQGNFQFNEANFPTAFTERAMATIRSDDPAKMMPPAAAGGKPFSQRGPGDPVWELERLLGEWIKKGRTTSPFTVPGAEGDPGAPPALSPYLMTPEVAAQLTNLGNCIPEPGLVGTATDKMAELDRKFAEIATFAQLPQRLDETDLVSLESATLARHGVVSFAPNYPLWSDSAGKMRHIRVPLGQSVAFDKATQRFLVPPNTRFYKTFLKKVVDRDGQESFRKIETRLIVSRPDRTLPDGSAEVAALAATYVWNDAETEATLLKEPLRSGQPFTDLMVTYITDEPRYRKVVDSKPRNLGYTLEVENEGLLRRYAVPGSTRCRECHMGSADASFSLGFTPLQIKRRAFGEGGTFEHSGADELSQLQRLVDYRVITGLGSADEILPLERSQEPRKPRSPEELTAQGYMLGNCAGCHNPRGFPSTKNKELTDLLDFQPGRPSGGIFEFPLDRTSPRIKRGKELSDPIAYITPSLRDVPRPEEADDTIWKPKFYLCEDRYECSQLGTRVFVDAPWRSLIYRNVDAPFSYSDDYAIYPHMPRNTPGFDCRAPRFMGEWMVSIPAKLKPPILDENNVMSEELLDRRPQPYVEVKPGDPDFEQARDEAKSRLTAYRKGSRYQYCPDIKDIVDSRVRQDPITPVLTPPDLGALNPETGKERFPPDNVPERPHWVVTDLTEAPVAWAPRRPDWDKVLVPQKLADKALTERQKMNLGNNSFHVYFSALEALNEVRITKQFREFALTPVPFGLWKNKPGCEGRLAQQRTVAQIAPAERPRWFDEIKPPGDAPVYYTSPGAAVFNLVCFSCHGTRADSKGIQAETLADLTGGDARVANLRDGLFGVGADGLRNLDRVFGPLAGLYPKGAPDARLVTAEDWAGRYVAWMALGGTLKAIPKAILNNVGAGKSLDDPRDKFFASGSPNMLEAAQLICTNAVPHRGRGTNTAIALAEFFRGSRFNWSDHALVEKNGDARLWLRLCSLNNRRIVRVIDQTWTDSTKPEEVSIHQMDSYYWADAYPASAPVMDEGGNVVLGVQDGNFLAMCVRKPQSAAQVALAESFLEKNRAGPAKGKMPFCPEEIFEADPADPATPRWRLRYEPGAEPLYLDVEAWAVRGAINAGLAVMLYLDQMQKEGRGTPRFDQCQELEAPEVTQAPKQ